MQTHTNAEAERHRLHERYEILKDRKLYAGKTTSVYLGLDLQHENRQVVVKKIQILNNPKRQAKIASEIEIMKLYKDQKRFVQFLDVFQTENEVYIVMEHVETDLLKYIRDHGAFDEAKAWKIFRQLVKAVYTMHKRGIFHGDIKLENILFNPSKGEIKLCDFGAATFSGSEEKHTATLGTPGYIAPEVWLSHEFGYNGFSNDVYAMGVVLYAMVFGSLPFSDREGAAYYTNLEAPRNGRRPDLKMKKPCSKALAKLLHGMLALEPQQRYNLAKIARHPWFQVEHYQALLQDPSIQNEFVDSGSSSSSSKSKLVKGIAKVLKLKK